MERKGETPQRVVVSILLKKEARDEESMNALVKRAAALGLEPTTKGRASMCFQTTPKNFNQLFRVKAKPVKRVAASEVDGGTPPGYQVDAKIPIPDAIIDYAELISVQPPATRLTETTVMSDLSSLEPGSTCDGKTKEDGKQEDGKQEGGKQEVDDKESKKDNS